MIIHMYRPVPHVSSLSLAVFVITCPCLWLEVKGQAGALTFPDFEDPIRASKYPSKL